VHSDVLGRNRVKPPDFRDIIVDVAFKKLQRDRETERERQREREREREIKRKASDVSIPHALHQT